MRLINKILYKEIISNTWWLVFIAVLMLAEVGFNAVAPWPFKLLIDNVLSPKPLETGTIIGSFLARFNSRELLGFFVILVYFLSTFALAIVEYVRAILAKRIIKATTASFSKNAFKNLQSIAIGFYKKQQIGDYIYRLSNDVSALGELLEEGILPFLTSSLYLIVTTTIMFLIDVRLTLFSLTALPFLAFGLYSFNTYITRATKQSEFFNSAALSFIEEALTHLKIIQAFSQERRESHAFGEKVGTQLKKELLIFRLDFLLTLLIAIIIAVSYSFIIVYGIRGVFAGELTTGLLIVFIFYLDNLTNPILSVIYAVAAIKQSYVRVSRMEDFFSQKTHLEYPGKVTTVADTRIKFDQVTVRVEKGVKILDDASFEIEPHKRTVIFGVSGSGKTTIVNLLLRFIDKPTRGKIFLGGYNLSDYDITALRNSIAFVPQEITLFNDTIRNNIAFGNPESSLRRVKQAAQLAAAHEFIKKIPAGYNFKVGEGGSFLSGGQRQRLMLARALMKRDAKILLFDETLSALDVKTRQEVIDNIYEFSSRKTMIIVSNIFAVVSAADNVIVLNKGKVIYSGSSHRLPKEIALYKLIVENG